MGEIMKPNYKIGFAIGFILVIIGLSMITFHIIRRETFDPNRLAEYQISNNSTIRIDEGEYVILYSNIDPPNTIYLIDSVNITYFEYNLSNETKMKIYEKDYWNCGEIKIEKDNYRYFSDSGGELYLIKKEYFAITWYLAYIGVFISMIGVLSIIISVVIFIKYRKIVS